MSTTPLSREPVRGSRCNPNNRFFKYKRPYYQYARTTSVELDVATGTVYQVYAHLRRRIKRSHYLSGFDTAQALRSLDSHRYVEVPPRWARLDEGL